MTRARKKSRKKCKKESPSATLPLCTHDPSLGKIGIACSCNCAASTLSCPASSMPHFRAHYSKLTLTRLVFDTVVNSTHTKYVNAGYPGSSAPDKKSAHQAISVLRLHSRIRRWRQPSSGNTHTESLQFPDEGKQNSVSSARTHTQPCTQNNHQESFTGRPPRLPAVWPSTLTCVESCSPPHLSLHPETRRSHFA